MQKNLQRRIILNSLRNNPQNDIIEMEPEL